MTDVLVLKLVVAPSKTIKPTESVDSQTKVLAVTQICVSETLLLLFFR